MASSSRYNFVLGTSVTVDDAIIPQNRLPTEENVLRAYQYFLEENLKGSQPAQHQALKRQTAKQAVNLIKET